MLCLLKSATHSGKQCYSNCKGSPAGNCATHPAAGSGKDDQEGMLNQLVCYQYCMILLDNMDKHERDSGREIEIHNLFLSRTRGNGTAQGGMFDIPQIFPRNIPPKHAFGAPVDSSTVAETCLRNITQDRHAWIDAYSQKQFAIAKHKKIASEN